MDQPNIAEHRAQALAELIHHSAGTLLDVLGPSFRELEDKAKGARDDGYDTGFFACRNLDILADEGDEDSARQDRAYLRSVLNLMKAGQFREAETALAFWLSDTTVPASGPSEPAPTTPTEDSSDSNED